MTPPRRSLPACWQRLWVFITQRCVSTSPCSPTPKISRASGCQQNGAAELWTVQGAGHVPFFNDTFYDALFAFYDAHAKL